MAMVLTPILKHSVSGTLNSPSSNNRVTFNLPEDNVIEYLKNDQIPYSTKLNSVTTKIIGINTEDSLLLKWIEDFKNNVLFLENNSKIITALLNLKWYDKNDEFVTTYQELILNLVTAHPSIINDVLRMVIKLFSLVQDTNEEITKVEERQFENAHKLLQNIIKLVPLCEKPLCTIANKTFPYMMNPTKVLNCYVQNLLHLTSYFPSKRLAILTDMFEKIISIDTLCARNLIEVAESEKEEEELQHMDEDLNNEDAEKKKEIMALPMAHTLDVIMNSIFEFIHKECFPTDGKTLDWEATKKLYKQLLTAFDEMILSARAYHVQYIMFYICSFKQELSDGFLDYLWKKVQNPSLGPIYRQTASFYIGSFLARAKYISINTVSPCLELMCNWIHSYIDNHTAQDLSVHGTFHSVCQTVFYVFAFRSQELLEIDKGFKFLRGLNFERIVSCRLNPLRFCNRNIVQNFANIARNFQIAYMYPIIERNNRNLIYVSPQSDIGYISGSIVETYFPFDPYLLKQSKHWIEPHYRIYSHCQKEEEPMDTVDEDETNAIDSLFMYCSSPGFKKSLARR